jgi:hypothetical protein
MPGRNMQEASGAISSVPHRNLHAEFHLTVELTTRTVILATFLAFCARNLYSIIGEKLPLRNPIVSVWIDKRLQGSGGLQGNVVAGTKLLSGRAAGG